MWSSILQNTEINTLIWCVAYIFKQWTCHIRPWSLKTCKLSDLIFFYKFGWVFHKFTENGEFYIGWFLPLTGIIETPVQEYKILREEHYNKTCVCLWVQPRRCRGSRLRRACCLPRGAKAGWQRARGACNESLAYNINTLMSPWG